MGSLWKERKDFNSPLQLHSLGHRIWCLKMWITDSNREIGLLGAPYSCRTYILSQNKNIEFFKSAADPKESSVPSPLPKKLANFLKNVQMLSPSKSAVFSLMPELSKAHWKKIFLHCWVNFMTGIWLQYCLVKYYKLPSPKPLITTPLRRHSNRL